MNRKNCPGGGLRRYKKSNSCNAYNKCISCNYGGASYQKQRRLRKKTIEQHCREYQRKIECHKIEYEYYQFDSYDYEYSNHYVSVYLSDYINLSQYQCKKPKIKYVKKSKNINKKQKNSFETYWNEMQKDRKKFNKKIQQNTEPKNHLQGMTNNIDIKIRNLLREYFILCNKHNMIKNSASFEKNKINKNVKPFSYEGIAKKIREINPWLKFSITSLQKYPKGGSLVFHGTDKKNVGSIIQKGLIIGGTKGVEIENGRAYGNGIYCSPNIQTASGYSNGAIFVCSALNANKFGSVWVVPKENQIHCCYLIRYEGGYISSRSISNRSVSTLRSNGIAIFIPALGKLNEPQKHRIHQRRFSNRNK